MTLNPNTGSQTHVDLDPGVVGQVVKATTARLTDYFLSNNSAGDRYIKFYNSPDAPTESDTPTWVIKLSAGEKANLHLGQGGLRFDNGLAYRVTTGIAHSDTGAPGTNDVLLNLGFE